MPALHWTKLCACSRCVSDSSPTLTRWPSNFAWHWWPSSQAPTDVPVPWYFGLVGLCIAYADKANSDASVVAMLHSKPSPRQGQATLLNKALGFYSSLWSRRALHVTRRYLDTLRTQRAWVPWRVGRSAAYLPISFTRFPSASFRIVLASVTLTNVPRGSVVAPMILRASVRGRVCQKGFEPCLAGLPELIQFVWASAPVAPGLRCRCPRHSLAEPWIASLSLSWLSLLVSPVNLSR